MLPDGVSNIVITGHYGCGKTNLTVNLAAFYARSGRRVTVADLDIVNPYFRSSDMGSVFENLNVSVIAPRFARTTLENPSISPEVGGAIRKPGSGLLIIDAGGDDAGAMALGRFSEELARVGYVMIYVVNRYRLLTATPQEALAVLREIEEASRLKATHVVNNSNLAELTATEDIEKAYSYGEEVARLAGLPLLFTTAPDDVMLPMARGAFFPVTLYVNKPWQ